jgi:chromosome partitioning protein
MASINYVRGNTMIISILNQKGGVGKTTLAVNLARAYTKAGVSTILVDSDSQGSAQRWHERGNGELIDMTCLAMNTLDKDVLKYKDRYDRIIIDGIPRVSPLTGCSIRAADLILIPVQPSEWDIWSTNDIVPIIKDRIEMTEGKLKAFFVVSRKIVGTLLGRKINEELLKMDLPVLESGTCQRVDYIKCIKNGLTVLDGEYYGKEACKEVEQILEEVEKKIGGR